MKCTELYINISQLSISTHYAKAVNDTKKHLIGLVISSIQLISNMQFGKSLEFHQRPGNY